MSFAPTLHGWFAAAKNRTPDATAIEAGDRAVTFVELAAAAERLARRLRALGVGPEHYVGISAPRSIEALTAILAVATAGGAYVPIDPELPEARRRGMVARCGIRVLLHVGAPLRLAATEIAVDAVIEDAPPFADDAHADHPFVVLHTSGTTGEPKAVVLAHRGIANYVDVLARSFEVGADDVILQFATLSFDISVEEIGLAWRSGARLVLRTDAMLDPDVLLAECASKGVTVLDLPTAYLPLVSEAAERGGGWPKTIRLVIVGGERLQPAWLAAYLRVPGAPRLVSTYGPTEASISVTACEGRDVVGRSEAPLGRALPGCEVHLLDDTLTPVPVGSTGEIHLGGVCLARGYLGAPGATADRFVPNPFVPGARLYRTGDLARIDADGLIDYVGRVDDQIKLRGFRIELGEIEAALMQVAGVRAAVAAAREDARGVKQLVAYVVGDVDGEDVRAALQLQLPAYAVPAAVVNLPALPLTDRGKVDRRALPAPTFEGTAYVAPRTPLEERLVASFGHVLGRARVGVNDDFFALGGDSLVATTLASRIRRTEGVALDLRRVFEAPTVADLAAHIASAQKEAADGIPRADGAAEASFAEERLWFLDQLDPNRSTYNVPLLLRIRGSLDPARFEWSLNAVVERHEALRTSFVGVDGKPRPVVHAKVDVPVRVVDAETDEAERAAILAATEAPFDLSRAPLLRAALVRRGADEHVVVITAHHIVTDGWSAFVMARDLAAFYVGRPLEPLPIQYSDYAAWQRRRLADGLAERQLAAWKDALAGAPASLDLPTDRSRGATRSERGRRVSFEVERGAVERFALRERATSFMVLLAAYAAVLARYANQDDVVVGVPIAGRTHPDTEDVVGFFVNTLPVRVRLDGGPSFRELVARVRAAALAAYENQDVPFERIVEALNPARDRGRTPIFQVMFAYQPAGERDAFVVPGLEVSAVAEQRETARFDLVLNLAEVGSRIEAALEYDSDLFDRETAAGIAQSFSTLLRAALEAGDREVADLPLLSDEDRERLLSSTDITPSRGDTLWSRLEAQPADAIAVEDAHERWTYGELLERARRVASHLVAHGVTPSDRVAISTMRSVRMIAAVYGVFAARAAYLPIDPKLPEERRSFMRTDAGARVQLDDETLAAALAHPVTALPTSNERDLAYVIYTSGSTGRPKGVMVEQRSIVNLVDAMLRTPGHRSDEATLALTTLSFDVAAAEIFVTLSAGGRLVVATEDDARDPALLADVIARTGVTTAGATPSTWQMLTATGWRPPAQLRIHTAGEALPAMLAARLVEDGARLFNLYGPTETTVYATGTEIRSGDAITIGVPVDGTTAYVLDDRLEPVPVGVVGQLYLGGAGVARGYLGRPALTAEKFVPDPFAKAAGARMYATGDVVRRRRDGTLDYLGRNDHQVKIRGFRIEIGEIEAAIAALENVRDVVVTVREDDGDKRLVAYVVVAPGRTGVAPGELRRTLPDYMVPAAFVVLDRLPQNANGKVDRRALPAPAFAKAATDYVAPRTETEAKLAAIFADVLRVDRVGVHDDFFALGGHSLLATRVAARASAALGAAVPVRRIFEAPTVASLATRIVGDRDAFSDVERVAKDTVFVASRAQERLWFLSQWTPDVSTYHVPLILRLRGELDVSALRRALDVLVERHESLRTALVHVEGRVQVRIESATMPFAFREASDVADARRFVHAEMARPFDLARAPLVRTVLARIAQEDHLLGIVMHHVVTDGWSLQIFERELSAVYGDLRDGRVVHLPALPVRYVDYAAWERAQGESTRSLTYWKEQMRGAPASLELPSDHPRPPVRTERGASFRFELPMATVHAFARHHDVTTFAVLLAALDVFLARHTGEKDIVVGTPTANRGMAAVEGVIGFFVNTLALRVDLAGARTFLDVVARAKKTVLDALAHQDLAFDRLVDALAPPRDQSRTPIFQMMLSYFEDSDQPQLGDLRVEREADALEVSKFDLSLQIHESPSGTVAAFEYDAALFDASTVAAFAARFCALVDDAIAMPTAPLDRITRVIPAERRLLIHEWNQTDRVPRRNGTLWQHLAAQAAATPDAIALEDASERWTYAVFAENARRVAGSLLERGLRPGERVAISVRRSVRMLAAVYGVLAARGAYLPIDPKLPVDRREFMRADADARLQLDDDSLAAALAGAPATSLPVPDERDLAYVLYTSGSTGRPKGVMVENRSVVSLVDAVLRDPGHRPDEAMLAMTTLSFDVAAAEIYVPLSIGARVVIASEDVARDPALLADLIARADVAVTGATPAALQMLVAAGWHPPSTLRIHACGEALPPALAARLLESGARLFNIYGPTETTVYATSIEVRPGDPITIGRPMDRYTAYVLDDALEPMPIGVLGQLYLGGEGVARGYLGRPALTAEKFVPDPFSRHGGARMYATGDVARWRPDGTLDFLGRNDHQVKLRGFRIELGEIEAALLALDGVAEAVVVAREDGGEKRLVAYVIAKNGRDRIDPGELKRTLPDYMVPSAFVFLERFPLNANGKLDRKALPAPDFSGRADEYVAPRTQTESVIVGVYSAVLRVERVGIHDDFFALGGHSLLATEAVAKLSSELGRDIPVRLLFSFPSAARLAEHLEAGRVVEAPPVRPTDVRNEDVLSFEEEYLLGWEAHRKNATVWNHGEEIELVGPLDEARLEEAFRRTIERQEALRRTFFGRVAGAKTRLVATDEVRWQSLDVRGTSDDEATKIASDLVTAPFGFDGTPMLRAFLMKRGDDRSSLVLNWHQAVHDHDAAGATLFASEILAMYGHLGGETRAPAPLGLRYADYAKWSHDWFDAPEGRADLDALRRKFAAVRPMPLADHYGAPGAERSLEMDAATFLLDADASARFAKVCRDASATRFMAAFAIVGVLMRRWRGVESVPLMTLRNFKSRRPELQPLAGRFTGPIPMVLHVDDGATWAEHFASAKRVALDAFAERGPTPVTRVFETDVPVDHPLGALTLNDMGVSARGTEETKVGGLRWRSSPMQGATGARALLQVGLITPDAADGRLLFMVMGARDRFHAGTITTIAKELQELVRGVDLSERPLGGRTRTRAPALTFRDPRTAPKDGLVAVSSDVPVDALEGAYRAGIFPFPLPAEPGTSEAPAVRWVSPDPRIVIALDEPPRWNRQFRQQALNHPYKVTFDEDFSGVLRMCASTRAETWMHPALVASFEELHRRGVAHSVEVWDGGELVGGVYGVAVGGFFAAESMFHTRKNASKIAFVSLVRKLTAAGYALVDGQFPAPHTRSFGFVEVEREDYLARLAKAVAMTPKPLLRGLLIRAVDTAGTRG